MSDLILSKSNDQGNHNLRQFLTFSIGHEHFGMDLHQTREIIEYQGVTSVPLMPSFLCGVINLRGEVVPVIDLNIRLGRKSIEVNKRTCVIIVELETTEQNVVLGLLADQVDEVIELVPESIEATPTFGTQIKAEFVQGLAKNGEDFIVILDAEKALSPTELALIVESELN